MGAEAPSNDAAPVASRRAGWATSLLAGFAVALAGYLASSHGLFFYPYAGPLQDGVFLGVLAALVTESVALAVICAPAAAVAGWLVLPPAADRTWLAFAGLVLASAAVAAAARWALGSGQLRRGVLFALALVLLLGNLWATTAVEIQIPDQFDSTVAQALAKPVAANTFQYDAQYYHVVSTRIHDGQSYYAAVAESYPQNARWKAEPSSVLMVREPLLFWIWAYAPGWPKSPIWAFLLLVTGAVAVSATGLDRVLGHGVALVGAAAATSFALQYSTHFDVFYHEVWAGFTAVLALGFMALAAGSKGRSALAFTAAAAFSAFVAFTMRELAVFVLVAGLASALFAPKGERRTPALIWAGAWIASALAWSAHAYEAAKIIRPGLNAAWIGRGGVAWVFSALTEGRMFLGGYSALWVMLAFCLAGIVGAAVLHDRVLRVFALLATLLPLGFFLVAGNGAVSTADSRIVNYWGSLVAPMLLLLSSAALALLFPRPAESPAPPPVPEASS